MKKNRPVCSRFYLQNTHGRPRVRILPGSEVTGVPVVVTGQHDVLPSQRRDVPKQEHEQPGAADTRTSKVNPRGMPPPAGRFLTPRTSAAYTQALRTAPVWKEQKAAQVGE